MYAPPGDNGQSKRVFQCFVSARATEAAGPITFKGPIRFGGAGPEFAHLYQVSALIHYRKLRRDEGARYAPHAFPRMIL
jgi:hypothetical protein